MTTKYKGIDYSLGLGVNRDNATGIRYGVISANAVLQTWADSSEAVYSEVVHADGCDDHDTCNCGDMDEPIGFTFNDGGYECTQSGDDGDIFIIRSPYFTYAQFCSPCAPGACYLASPIDDRDPNNRCYCFGFDWFDSEYPCPYPVYSVATGKQIKQSSAVESENDNV